MPGQTPIVGDVLQVTHVWTCQNQIAENTLHYVVTAVGGGGVTINDIAGDFALNMSTEAPPLLPSIASYYGAMCRNLVAPQTRDFKISIPTPGTVSASVIPKQVCPIISFFTPVGGPANRGRIYLPFMPISFASSAGQLSAGGRAAYLAALPGICPPNVTVVAAAQSTTLQLVIRHGRGQIPFPVPAASWTGVNGRVIQSKLGTQRKRGDYGRTNVPDF